MKRTNIGETIMNVKYYLKIMKRCPITGLLLVGVKTGEDGQALILDDIYDAKVAQTAAEEALRLKGDFDTVVTRVRMVDEYVEWT